MKMDIIATIGAGKTDFDEVKEIINKGINHLRFNFSKYNEKNIIRVDLIKKIKKCYGDSVTIMLDIPYPGKKARIYHSLKKFVVKKGDEYILESSSEFKYDKCFFIDISKIGKIIKEGTIITYSDGEAKFVTKKIIDDSRVIIKAENDFLFISGKSLSFDYPKCSNSVEKELINLIFGVNPDEIALSFVEEKKSIDELKYVLNEMGCKAKIYSKIETQKGIDNINEISKKTDVIIGRGDLCLYTDYHKLYNNQKLISKSVTKNNRSFYVATGILSSLIRQNIPSQSDIIDLSVISDINAKGIIVNSMVVFNNIDMVIQTIENMNI